MQNCEQKLEDYFYRLKKEKVEHQETRRKAQQARFELLMENKKAWELVEQQNDTIKALLGELRKKLQN